MKLRIKLPLAFAMSLLLLLAGGAFGIFQLNAAVAIYQDDVLRHVAGHKKGAEISAHFATAVQEWKNVLLRGKDPNELTRYWTAHQVAMREVQTQLAELDRLLEPASPMRGQVTKLSAEMREAQTGYQAALDAYKSSGFDAKAGDTAAKGNDREAMAILSELRAMLSSAEIEADEAAAQQAKDATRIAISVMVAVTLISSAVGLTLTRKIVMPLQGSVGVAKKVAIGDLTTRIDIHGNDEVTELLVALETMQASLIALVEQVLNGAKSVANASSEIAQGNSDLANRTERQAGALQETASSMESLCATVTHNADNAQRARELADAAAAIALTGGAVVGQVVETMRSIQESSHRIADIIGVIDGIAFQTNILALNAAVEAARAGEQGRGFAVVASEVRALAGRSASAAKEIKALISSSVGTVETGSQLVSKAGSTMSEVVSTIQQLSATMGTISSESAGQSRGIAQVGAAMVHIDQATQENAALVEQMAQAASVLTQQAADLVRLVSVFRINDTNSIALR